MYSIWGLSIYLWPISKFPESVSKLSVAALVASSVVVNTLRDM